MYTGRSVETWWKRLLGGWRILCSSNGIITMQGCLLTTCTCFLITISPSAYIHHPYLRYSASASRFHMGICHVPSTTLRTKKKNSISYFSAANMEYCPFCQSCPLLQWSTSLIQTHGVYALKLTSTQHLHDIETICIARKGRSVLACTLHNDVAFTHTVTSGFTYLTFSTPAANLSFNQATLTSKGAAILDTSLLQRNTWNIYFTWCSLC